MTRFLLISFLLLAGCVQLPPPPGDAQAKRFETVPDKAVIYVVRHSFDKDFVPTLQLDGQMIGPSYRGTFVRIVAPTGEHQLTGFAGDSGAIRFSTEPGKLYFIEQKTWGFRGSFYNSTFELAKPEYARPMVLAGTLNYEIIR